MFGLIRGYCIFMRPTFWPVVAAAVGGGLGLLGARQANKSAEGIADNQINFQREMSNSAYQRATQDMKSAGLNPMLAYSQGGASTPSGASAPVTNELGAAASGAAAGAQSVMQLKAMDAGIDQSKATTLREVATARANTASANQTELQTAAAVAELQARARSAEYRADIDKDERFRSNARWNAETGGNLEASRRAELGLNLPHLQRAQQDARRARSEALLREYQLPGAKKEADYQSDPFGGKYDMYIPDLGAVLNSATSVGLKYRE